MDKADLRNKRQKDKHHKKVPAPKSPKQTTKQKNPEVQHTAPLVVCDYRYGKRQIQKNWSEDRDLPPDGSDSEDEQRNAADFEKLLAFPPSTSGHFLLSSEKYWLEPETGLPDEDQKNRYSKYFHIDTKLLNASLGCIPFYQRLGYDESLFSAEELLLMRQKAEIQTTKYKQLCKEHDIKMETVSSKEIMPVSSKPKPAPCLVGKHVLTTNSSNHCSKQQSEVKVTQPSEDTASEATVFEDAAERKMDALKISVRLVTSPTVASTCSSKINTIEQTKTLQNGTSETKEDIQQWLDDILDI